MVIPMTMKQPKWIQTQDVLHLVGDHMKIVVGMVACEPFEFLRQLHSIHDRIHNITVVNCLPMRPHPFIADNQYSSHFTIHSWFLSKPLRHAYEHGNIAYIPNHLHQAGTKWLDIHQPDLYVGAASYPNAEGYISLSLSNVYEMRMLKAAKRVVLEVNKRYPFTFGDVLIHQSEIDYLVETNYPVIELNDEPIQDIDVKIGQWIAPMIPDGACLQLGIGGIPNAVAHTLTSKKNLGVHTEMLTNGILTLFESGAITNREKKLHPGKIVCTFVAGSQRLYDFVHMNPHVLVMDGHYVNNPDVIKNNPKQVSINSTIEVDLTGQCCSESIGGMPFSGTGGQADTATGAVKSRGGQSFITLHSATMATNSVTGKKEEISKIVPYLKPGAIVSLSRNDVDHVVTEYGVASLRGLDTKTRAMKLIAIAHPKFRDQLTQEARRLKII